MPEWAQNGAASSEALQTRSIASTFPAGCQAVGLQAAHSSGDEGASGGTRCDGMHINTRPKRLS